MESEYGFTRKGGGLHACANLYLKSNFFTLALRLRVVLRLTLFALLTKKNIQIPFLSFCPFLPYLLSIPV